MNISLTPVLVVHWAGGVLPALPTLEAPGMGEAHKGEDPFLHLAIFPGQPHISNNLHHLLNPRHPCTNDGFAQRNR